MLMILVICENIFTCGSWSVIDTMKMNKIGCWERMNEQYWHKIEAFQMQPEFICNNNNQIWAIYMQNEHMTFLG